MPHLMPGTPQTPDNVRTRVVAPAVKAANLAASSDAPDDAGALIGHCSPHSLRRTYASMLAEIGVTPRRAM
ncbi:MAG: hypothetical protein JWO02_221 [Solirubrobacterales bacterium]|nr:hypothetical protein [Solirubrobacterales bacterium]